MTLPYKTDRFHHMKNGNLVLALTALFLTQNTWATSLCKEYKKIFKNIDNLDLIEKAKPIQSTLPEDIKYPDNILSKESWKKLDVLSDFEYNRCVNNVQVSDFKIHNNKFIKIRTTEDECDGGNSYGVIVLYDLTPVAHIYDGDIYCEDSFKPEYKAANHKCDLAVEELATQKLASMNMPLTETESQLTIRSPYIYSFIDVTGKIQISDEKTKNISLRAHVILDTCKIDRISISDLVLD